MEVAWSGEESQTEPSEEKVHMCGGGGMWEIRQSSVTAEWGASISGKLVTYRGTEQIKYIKDKGDQIGIAREGSYKY